MVAASAGNHAQGTALAASLTDIHSTVFMPEAAPLPKIEATKRYGAEVELVGKDFDEAFDAAMDVRRGARCDLRAPVRPPAHHRRSGNVWARDPRADAECQHHRRADGGRGPGLRHRDRGQGAEE